MGKIINNILVSDIFIRGLLWSFIVIPILVLILWLLDLRSKWFQKTAELYGLNSTRPMFRISMHRLNPDEIRTIYGSLNGHNIRIADTQQSIGHGSHGRWTRRKTVFKKNGTIDFEISGLRGYATRTTIKKWLSCVKKENPS